MKEKIIVELFEKLLNIGLAALTSSNLNEFILQILIDSFISFGFWFIKKEN
ncbi:hypothetical protein MH122_14215 [Bacillus pumilus]|uniref:hypothetical protein n=1 Tax=Bacillus pumilus TaxID=1408 RepID=UPI00227DEB21|nr:hypothetical protein [Bacillus pumilus]MCY7679955.1 hypothetical protein [Bacillus pumilus]